MRLVAERRPDLTATVCDLYPRECNPVRERAIRGCRSFVPTSQRSRIITAAAHDRGGTERRPLLRTAACCLLGDAAQTSREPGVLSSFGSPTSCCSFEPRGSSSRILALKSRRSSQDRVRYFNPEHVYIFTRRYLVARPRARGYPRRCARFPHPSCPPDLAGEKSADPRSSHWQRPLTPSLAIGRR